MVFTHNYCEICEHKPVCKHVEDAEKYEMILARESSNATYHNSISGYRIIEPFAIKIECKHFKRTPGAISRDPITGYSV